MKIKRLLKYIIPIVLVVGVVICFLVSRMQKPTGRDNVITSNVDLPQDDNGNYIAQRYESNLIPSDTGFTVNDQPVDNVIRVDDGESGEDSDYILVEIEEQDVKELFKKEDLLDGHPTTDHIIEVTENMQTTTDLVEYKGSDTYPLIGLPSDLAYDTKVTKRILENETAYIGMLYGKWPYLLTEEQQQQYNFSAELIIASHYAGIVLEEQQTTEGEVIQKLLDEGMIKEIAFIKEVN